jgi:hypothetical protein
MILRDDPDFPIMDAAEGAYTPDEIAALEEANPYKDRDACEECGGSGKVIYDPVGEGPIPCKTCNGRGF